MTLEIGWLIENGEEGDELLYRTMDQGAPMWTADHMKALRFARRVDAELFAQEDEDAWRIVEHAWTDRPARVSVCGVDCKPHDALCNGYCEGKTDMPPPAPPPTYAMHTVPNVK